MYLTLIDDCKAKALLANKDYDTDEIVEYATHQGMIVVIVSAAKEDRRPHDQALYKLRQLVEGVFLHLKR